MSSSEILPQSTNVFESSKIDQNQAYSVIQQQPLSNIQYQYLPSAQRLTNLAVGTGPYQIAPSGSYYNQVYYGAFAPSPISRNNIASQTGGTFINYNTNQPQNYISGFQNNVNAASNSWYAPALQPRGQNFFPTNQQGFANAQTLSYLPQNRAVFDRNLQVQGNYFGGQRTANPDLRKY